jgi:hypothetical protein
LHGHITTYGGSPEQEIGETDIFFACEALELTMPKIQLNTTEDSIEISGEWKRIDHGKMMLQ